MSLSNFISQIQMPIYDWIDSQGIDSQIDFIAFSRDIPYRVEYDDGSKVNNNGITSVMFYGYKEYPSTPVCTIPIGSTNQYFEAERAFSASDPVWGTNRVYLSSILSGWTKEDSLSLIERSVLSDGASPTGEILLVRSADPFRNVRWPQFEETDFQGRFQSQMAERDFFSAGGFFSRTNIVGASIGVFTVNRLFDDNHFQAGAIADHLTSYGGVLFKEFAGQMSILDWLLAGASGSYGTVVEPCNYIEKFPRVRVHNWYAQGFNLAEAYAMAVEVPYMGIVVGDPLTQPYAQRPSVDFSSVTNGQRFSGSAVIEWTAQASESVRVGEVELYINSLFSTQLFEAVTGTGLTYSVTLDTNIISDVLSEGLSLEEALIEVGATINASTAQFSAVSRPGRIQLFQDSLRTSASTFPVSISFSDPLQKFSAESPTDYFLESEYSARMLMGLQGTPGTGDVIQAVVTRLDNQLVTNSVVSLSSGDTSKSLILDLMADMQSDPDLMGSNGCAVSDFTFNTFYGPSNLGLLYLTANTPGWTGSNMRVDFDVISSTLNDTSVDTYFNHNESVMSGRAELQAALGSTSLVSSFVWDTSALPNGHHELQLVASSGRAEAAQEVESIGVVVSNSPFRTWIYSPAPGDEWFLGQDVTGRIETAGGLVTNLSLRVEGHVIASTLASSLDFSFSTLTVGAGEVVLQAYAQSTGGVSAVSGKTTLYVLPNDDLDFDGLSDDWETIHFGSITHYSGTEDPDFDGQDNRTEFCAGTQPTNMNHYFRFTDFSITGGVLRAKFNSGLDYEYHLESIRPSVLVSTTAWDVVDMLLGDGSTTLYSLPVSVMDTNRLYRLRAVCPSLLSD